MDPMTLLFIALGGIALGLLFYILGFFITIVFEKAIGVVIFFIGHISFVGSFLTLIVSLIWLALETYT